MNRKISDSELFNALKEGDQNAYKILFYRFYEILVLFSFNIIKDQSEAEDNVTDVLEKISREVPGVKDYKHLRAWLYTAVRSRSLNYYNRRMNKIISFDEASTSEPSEDSVYSMMLCAEIIGTIEEEINRLKSADKVIAEYLFLEEMTVKEVAEILNIPEQTVRNKKSIFKERFWSALQRKGLPMLLLF